VSLLGGDLRRALLVPHKAEGFMRMGRSSIICLPVDMMKSWKDVFGDW
jgi:hypothetical protein